MGQPDIADFQVDLTTSLQGKIDINDLKDVSAPNPNEGNVLAWNDTSSKWEPVSGSISYYIEIAANGTGTVLPSGWSSSKTGTGTYTITHNLGTTELGFALIGEGGVTAVVSLVSSTVNTVNLITNSSGLTIPADNPFSGRIII